MNILLSINKQYIKVAAVLIRSIMENNEDSFVFYILHDDIEPNDQMVLCEIIQDYSNRFSLKFCLIKDNTFKTIDKIGSNRWPKTVYYRLLAPYILDESVDRILYLDADMIVNGKLNELYNIDFSNNLVAMCEDTFVNDYVEYNKRLDIPSYRIYYNSGMVLMNLKQIRMCVEQAKIYELADSKYDQLLFPDQDILNILFNDACINVDYRKYNFICSYQRESDEKLLLHSKNAIIFHFAGGKHHKPWEMEYVGNFFEIYWKYAKGVWGEELYKKTYMRNKYFKQIIKHKMRIELFFEFHHL